MEKRKRNRRASAAESSGAGSSSILHFLHHYMTGSLYSLNLLSNNPYIEGAERYSDHIKKLSYLHFNFGDLHGTFRFEARQIGYPWSISSFLWLDVCRHEDFRPDALKVTN